MKHLVDANVLSEATKPDPDARAQLLADLRKKGRPMSVQDNLIAATALTHGLAIATLNRRDFEPARVKLVDPAA